MSGWCEVSIRYPDALNFVVHKNWFFSCSWLNLINITYLVYDCIILETSTGAGIWLLTDSETLQLSLEAAPKNACLFRLHPQPEDILILCLGLLHCWQMNPEFPKKRQLRRLGLLDAVLQCCTLWLNDRQSLQVFKVRVCVCWGGGGVGSPLHDQRGSRIRQI